MFIVIEGIDGSGKTTFAKELVKNLLKKNIAAKYTYEPWKSKAGELIRYQAKVYSAEDLATLFLFDREEHVKKEIEPLKNKIILICDRYIYSTLAYQAAQGLDISVLTQKNNRFPKPDLVIYLDLDPEEAIERIKNERGEIEEVFEKKSFLEKVKKNYEKVLPANTLKLDAKKSIEENVRFVLDEVFEI